MVWTLSHDNKIVGEWTDEFVQRLATEPRKINMQMIAEFLPDPIRNKSNTKKSSHRFRCRYMNIMDIDERILIFCL
jgi:hypothetical protein